MFRTATTPSSPHRTASVWLSVLLLLAGCATPASPPTRFFVLSSLAQGEPGLATATTPGVILEIEPVEIPQYLNRPEIVIRAGGNRLQLERMNQWGGDFKEDLGRVTLENLSRLLRSDRVILLPNKTDQSAQFRLTTSINRFEPDETGQVLLDARWSLFDGHGKLLLTRHSRLNSRAEQADNPESLAKAMSQALAQLNREMGEAILGQTDKR